MTEIEPRNTRGTAGRNGQSMIVIDGSQGEGGGQMLRSSLALSIATGQAFRMINIRAGREKPGLMRQHLTCVQAAAAISGAEVVGAAVGSREITFVPGRVRAGDYHFPIGTAGGTTLVLQAVLPALLIAGGPSTVIVEGGTHNKAAPPFEFFERALVPLLNRAGAGIAARLERHGFYPAGGGRVVVQVRPGAPFRTVEVMESGGRSARAACAIVSRLSGEIAQRELQTIRERLGFEEHETRVLQVGDPVGPGNAVYVELVSEHITEVFSAIGELGKSAETVAREAADEAREYIASGAPVGPHLADQLMVPLALMAGGRYRTGGLSGHSRTNMDVLRRFGAEAGADEGGVIDVRPAMI